MNRTVSAVDLDRITPRPRAPGPSIITKHGPFVIVSTFHRGRIKSTRVNVTFAWQSTRSLFQRSPGMRGKELVFDIDGAIRRRERRLAFRPGRLGRASGQPENRVRLHLPLALSAARVRDKYDN